MSKFYLISPLILQKCLWPFTWLFFGVICRWQVSGLENLKYLKTGKGIVFAVNHTSEMDPILVPAAFPFSSKYLPMFYTSRRKDFYSNSGWRQIFYGGFFFKIWGAHALNSGKRNYEISLQNHIELLKEGKSLCIFPEGKTTRDGNLMEGRGGTAYLADKLGCPIVPVYLGGLFKLSFKDLILRRRKLSVSFGEPLYRHDLFHKGEMRSASDYKAGTAVIMSAIADLKKRTF